MHMNELSESCVRGLQGLIGVSKAFNLDGELVTKMAARHDPFIVLPLLKDNRSRHMLPSDPVCEKHSRPAQ